MEQSTSIMRYVAGTAAALLLVITCGVANAEGGPYTEPSDSEAGGASSASEARLLERVKAAKAGQGGDETTASTSGTSAASQAEPSK
jgi:hypothetical protein